MKISAPFARTLAASLVALAFSACSGNEPPDALLAKAQAIRTSDPKAAEIHLKNLLQQDENHAEARFLLGQLYHQANDLRSAEKEYRRARDLSYDTNKVVPPLLDVMLGLGQLKEVVEEGRNVALSDPHAQARALTAVGRAQLQLGKAEDARKSFAGALSSQADYGPAQVGMATLQAAEDRPGALKAVEAILGRDPKDAGAWALKGDLDLAERRFGPARDAYRKAIELVPEDSVSRSKLVAAMIEENDLEGARREQAELAKRAPNGPITHYLLALIESRSDNNAAALESARESLRLAPEYLPAVGLAAGLSLTTNSLEQAERYARQLVERAPQNPVGYRVLGATYLRMNQPDRALEVVRPGLKRFADDAALLSIAGEATLKMNEPAAAADYFQRASKLAPDSARTRTGLALSHLASGDQSKGIDELEEAIELDSSNLQADVALVATLLRERQYDKALAAVQRMEKKAPKNPMPATLRGAVLSAKGDTKGARAAFEKALQLDPKYYSAAANLAALDLRDGQPGEARQRYEAVLAKDPKNSQAAVALALLTARTGGTREQVLEQLKKAREANPDAVLPILASARFMIDTNAPKDAIPMLQEATNRNPSDVRILDLLGTAFARSEQRSQAIGAWERILRLNPKAAGPHYRIGEVQLADGNRDAALQSFRKASELAPTAIEPKTAMANVLYQQGRKDEAMRIAKQMRDNATTKLAGVLLEADLLAADGKWPEASERYRTAFAQQRTMPIGMKAHAALRAAKRESEADALLRDWLRAEPSNLALRMYVGDNETARKRWKEAFEQYSVVLEKEPKNPVALNNAAWALHELDDARATDYGRRAYEAAPKAAAVVDTYGTILSERGDRKGLDLLRQAVEMAPTHPQLRLHLAEALARFDDKAGARKEIETLLKSTSQGPVAESARELQARLR